MKLRTQRSPQTGLCLAQPCEEASFQGANRKHRRTLLEVNSVWCQLERRGTNYRTEVWDIFSVR
ncbi:hypothetical protein, partial [Escherichia coli]|uniref:hypothetical protein n=1 Tax=Escherichia coli TaxID=562 RepID=UPI0028971423